MAPMGSTQPQEGNSYDHRTITNGTYPELDHSGTYKIKPQFVWNAHNHLIGVGVAYCSQR